MNIRKSTLTDLPVLLDLYAQARAFMAQNGNASQWGTNYPPQSVIQDDIQNGNSFVCEHEGRIIATFYFQIGEDETYQKIYDGSWLNEKPYGVVHRITSDGTVKGTASFCLNWAYSQCGNLKIDTHKDNHIMQHLLEKNGFTYCGIIYIGDESERIAYQKKTCQP